MVRELYGETTGDFVQVIYDGGCRAFA